LQFAHTLNWCVKKVKSIKSLNSLAVLNLVKIRDFLQFLKFANFKFSNYREGGICCNKKQEPALKQNKTIIYKR